MRHAAVLLLLLIAAGGPVRSNESAAPGPADLQRFRLMDVFQLEWASDPRISPDGQRIAYVRNFMDVMADRRRSNLWIVDLRGGDHRPITTGTENHHSPRWSPGGDRLLYVSGGEGAGQLFLRWMDTGQTAKLTHLLRSPQDLRWSRDGKWIAFSMLVPHKPQPLVELPEPPPGAEWADAPRVIEKLVYRADGTGFLEDGYRHLFVLSADGGTPRQVTFGSFNDADPAWSADGGSLLFSSNRNEEWEYDPTNSEIYEVSLSDGSVRALTDRQGPDAEPEVSPDGTLIAYTGYDDRLQGYQVTQLHVMRRDGTLGRRITRDLDRDVRDARWNPDGKGLYFRYADRGNTRIGYISLAGEVETLAGDVGGTSIGRPYASGSLTVASNGSVAFVQTRPEYPADVAVAARGSRPRRLTTLNADLLDHKQLGRVEEIWFTSSFDGRRVQGWIVTPPDFDPRRKYPLILEIHGGPFADYGDRFAAEIQLFAAAGYVVLYLNPRGSTGYGEEFGNLIHHAYPGNDYDDLMSGVDAVIARGHVDEANLFVTGGSGGGVLTSWIVGKTDRFRAAVVAKPVINWYSFALTADAYNFFYRYWFPGFPWDHPQEYMRRSPISLVGNVTTPTMVLTGEEDYRTPMSESEQYYQALKLRKIDAALVRVPGASHGIARRPSQLMAKVAHILAWFERHRATEPSGP